MKEEKYKFEKEEIKELMKKLKAKTPEEALEKWAYGEYDLRHNCSYYIKRVGKTFIIIGETP